MDLKLKLCRGDSARKIIAREARSFCAWKVLVGVSRTHNAIRSSASVAKYLAKKLPKECWVHAVNNGKVVFQREGSPPSLAFDHSQGLTFFLKTLFLFLIARSSGQKPVATSFPGSC